MTTLHRRPAEQAVDWLIQRDSSSWGDEAERLRYYEAHSASLLLVLMVQPLVAAVAIFVGGRAVVPTALALWLTPMLLVWVGVRYLEAKKVRVWQLAVADRRSTALRMLPNVAPLVAIVWANRNGDAAEALGLAAGALVGGLVAWMAVRQTARRRDELQGDGG